MTGPQEQGLVSFRYIVDDVQAAVDFYTTHLGFTVRMASPGFADVVRGPLRSAGSTPPYPRVGSRSTAAR